MSASTRTAPAQLSLGRIPSAFASLALVVILAVALAVVALNGTKAAPAKTGAEGAAPPAVIDHGWSNGETKILPKVTTYGGWNGPRLSGTSINDRLKGETRLDGGRLSTGGGHNGARRAQ
jgi:hypothetical protein